MEFKVKEKKSSKKDKPSYYILLIFNYIGSYKFFVKYEDIPLAMMLTTTLSDELKMLDDCFIQTHSKMLDKMNTMSTKFKHPKLTDDEFTLMHLLLWKMYITKRNESGNAYKMFDIVNDYKLVKQTGDVNKVCELELINGEEVIDKACKFVATNLANAHATYTKDNKVMEGVYLVEPRINDNLYIGISIEHCNTPEKELKIDIEYRTGVTFMEDGIIKYDGKKYRLAEPNFYETLIKEYSLKYIPL